VASLAIFYAMTPLAIVAIFAGLIANRQPAKKTSNYRHKQWLWPLVALALAETIPLFINEKTFASSPPRVVEIIIWYVMVATAPLAIAWILSNLYMVKLEAQDLSILAVRYSIGKPRSANAAHVRLARWNPTGGISLADSDNPDSSRM